MEDIPDSPTETQKTKKEAAKNAQLPQIQLLDDKGNTVKSESNNSRDQPQGSWESRKSKKRKKEKGGLSCHYAQTARPLNNGAEWCWSCPKTARRSRTLYRRYVRLTTLITISISDESPRQRTAPYWYAPEKTWVCVSGFWGTKEQLRRSYTYRPFCPKLPKEMIKNIIRLK